MTAHRRHMHGKEPAIDWDRLPVCQTEHHPYVYNVRFTRLTKRCPSPFPCCPGSVSTWNGLHSHFNSHKWGDSIRTLEEHPNPLPMCEGCGRQVPGGRPNTRNCASKNCKQGEECRRRHNNLQRCFEASRVSFQINAETLPPSEAFPYLVWKITYNNRNWEAVYQNLRKARRRWVMIARVMAKTGATVRKWGMMYKAATQSVLLYGSESWVVTGDILKVLEGFLHRAARRITEMTAAHGEGGHWFYPWWFQKWNLRDFIPLESTSGDGRRPYQKRYPAEPSKKSASRQSKCRGRV